MLKTVGVISLYPAEKNYFIDYVFGDVLEHDDTKAISRSAKGTLLPADTIISFPCNTKLENLERCETLIYVANKKDDAFDSGLLNRIFSRIRKNNKVNKGPWGVAMISDKNNVHAQILEKIYPVDLFLFSTDKSASEQKSVQDLQKFIKESFTDDRKGFFDIWHGMHHVLTLLAVSNKWKDPKKIYDYEFKEIAEELNRLDIETEKIRKLSNGSHFDESARIIEFLRGRTDKKSISIENQCRFVDEVKKIELDWSEIHLYRDNEKLKEHPLVIIDKNLQFWNRALAEVYFGLKPKELRNLDPNITVILYGIHTDNFTAEGTKKIVDAIRSLNK